MKKSIIENNILLMSNSKISTIMIKIIRLIYDSYVIAGGIHEVRGSIARIAI